VAIYLPNPVKLIVYLTGGGTLTGKLDQNQDVPSQYIADVVAAGWTPVISASTVIGNTFVLSQQDDQDEPWPSGGGSSGGGSVGPTGPTGPTGPAGVIGTPGEDGEDGADSLVPGPQGLTGASGTAGPQGPAGAFIVGIDGADGEDGLPGVPGVAGAGGSAGAAGATGPQGPVGFGLDGDPGEDGMPGILGPSGVAGAAGAAGPTGPQGPVGFGMDGDQGDQGDPAWGTPTVGTNMGPTRAQLAPSAKNWTFLGRSQLAATATTVGPVIWTGTYANLYFEYIIVGYIGSGIGRILCGASTPSVTAATNSVRVQDQNGVTGATITGSTFASAAVPQPGIPLTALAASVNGRSGVGWIWGNSGSIKAIKIEGNNMTSGTTGLGITTSPNIFIGTSYFSDLSTNLPIQQVQLTSFSATNGIVIGAAFSIGTYISVWGRNND